MTEALLGPDVLAAVERLKPVDLVVAFVDPTPSDALDHAVRAAEVGLALHFPDRRPLLVTVVDAATGAAPFVASPEASDAVEQFLFTRPTNAAQRAQLAVPNAPGAGARAALAVASAAGSEAVLLLDGDLQLVLPEWVELLLAPILNGRADVVLPLATRHKFDDVTSSVLTTPLLRGLYGAPIERCGGLTAGLGAAAVEAFVGAAGGLTSVAASALAADLRLVEARVGPAASAGRATSSSEVGALLAELVAARPSWSVNREVGPLVRYGFERRGEPPAVRVDPVEWLRVFERAADAHRDRWSELFGPPILNAVLGLAVTAAGVGLSARDWLNLDRGADIGRLDTPTLAGAMATFDFPDDVWARAVADSLLAVAHGRHSADEVADGLLPVLLGRAASFVVAARRSAADEVEALIGRQAVAFARQRAHLLAAWPAGSNSVATRT